MFTMKQKVMAEFAGTALFNLIAQTNQQKGFVELGLFIALLKFGGISGGHFNPSQTLGFMIIKYLSIQEGSLYILAQFLGALFGIFFIQEVFFLGPFLAISQDYRTNIQSLKLRFCMPRQQPLLYSLSQCLDKSMPRLRYQTIHFIFVF